MWSHCFSIHNETQLVSALWFHVMMIVYLFSHVGVCVCPCDYVYLLCQLVKNDEGVTLYAQEIFCFCCEVKSLQVNTGPVTKESQLNICRRTTLTDLIFSMVVYHNGYKKPMKGHLRSTSVKLQKQVQLVHYFKMGNVD